MIRALEFTEHVHILQLEDDETERNIAIESGGNVFHHSNWSTAPEIANSLKELIITDQIIVIWEGGGSPRRKALLPEYKYGRNRLGLSLIHI